jgi:hypothetical protein
MNLCDDLHSLAAITPQASTDDQWKRVLGFLTLVMTKDTYIDFAEPILGALLTQCSVAGTQVTASSNLASDSSTLTYTIHLT